MAGRLLALLSSLVEAAEALAPEEGAAPAAGSSEAELAAAADTLASLLEPYAAGAGDDAATALQPAEQLVAMRRDVLPAAARLSALLLEQPPPAAAVAADQLLLARGLIAADDCCNPRCATLQGMQQLRKCSTCHAASFCSPACMRVAWKAGHKVGLARQRAAGGKARAACIEPPLPVARRAQPLPARLTPSPTPLALTARPMQVACPQLAP